MSNTSRKAGSASQIEGAAGKIDGLRQEPGKLVDDPNMVGRATGGSLNANAMGEAKAALDRFAAKLTRQDLLDRAKAALADMTDEEDAAIRKAALADSDAQPVDELMARRGRPPSANKKQPVMLRLDRDVVESFKAAGDGWQTRINAALRKAAGLK